MCRAGKQGGKKRKARSPAGEAAPPEAACAAFGKVVRYATRERCRRAMLLEHFGERRSETCQGCDYCQRPLEVSAQVLSPLQAFTDICRVAPLHLGSTAHAHGVVHLL